MPLSIYAPRETAEHETRAALTPQAVKHLVALGIGVSVEPGLGKYIHASDADYADAGAQLAPERHSAIAAADLIVRVRQPQPDEVTLQRSGSTHLSFVDPFNNRDLVMAMAQQGISTISMEMVPRITRAQKMDALSSQASLGGYGAVMLACEELDKIFPMMMTAAGTITPARVFVIGVGVAGLQAIATAKRLGARVEAFDTRPVVEEQVQSLGARFIRIDLGDTGQTEGGYARELTPEQLQIQRDEQARVCAYSDVVITTAQVFGRPAPRLITAETLERMKPGSVVVDMAAETGGNVEGSIAGEVVQRDNGVRVVGARNLPARVPVDASLVYANNLCHLIEDFWDAEAGELVLRDDDEIAAGCVITRGGEVVNSVIRSAYGLPEQGGGDS